MPTRTGTRLFHLPANTLNQLAAQTITQARTFAGRAEDEKPVHAAGQNVFDQPSETGHVERVAVSVAA